MFYLYKSTFEKMLSLSNILFISFLRRNLVSSTILDITGLKIAQEVGKVIIMQNGDFVGKEYCNGGLLVLNAAAQVNNETAINSAYIAESVDLWHGRLGHVNFASLKRLRNMQLISNGNTENCSKCPVYVEQNLSKIYLNQ